MKSINSVSLLLLLLLLPLQARALSGDREQPIYLEADSVEIDEASGVSVYIGNVVVSQGSMRLEADKMWIHRR
ncbi:LptA protein, partial [Candidatus Endoriftia persephone str. Guaymas]|nr:LptA protein [Candidatus Endoriftia persephone str. Guaymas]